MAALHNCILTLCLCFKFVMKLKGLVGIVFVLALTQRSWVYGQQNCKQYSSCGCSTGDTHVDLSPLGSKSGPRWDHQREEIYSNEFSYNPCYKFTQGECRDAAVCQYMTGEDKYFECGSQDSATFISDSTGLTIRYEKTDDLGVTRTSEVLLKCIDKGLPDKLEVHGEIGHTLYTFTLNSYHCCPKPGGRPGSESEGLSGGSILLIVFFVLIVVYAVAGFMVQKYGRKKEGRDMLPNYAFWVALPGLVKEGVLFTISKFKKSPKYDQV